MTQDYLLAANRAFYEAFNRRDLVAMDGLWARDHPVACIHPGWTPLADRIAVMGSWREILSNPASPLIRHRDERVLLYGDVAAVLCLEVIGQSVLAATNLFVREGGGWRLAHHQASPVATATQEDAEQRPPKRRLH